MKVINVVKSYSFISPYFDADTESVKDDSQQNWTIFQFIYKI